MANTFAKSKIVRAALLRAVRLSAEGHKRGTCSHCGERRTLTHMGTFMLTLQTPFLTTHAHDVKAYVCAECALV